MIDWLARANNVFSQKPPTRTDETDKTILSSVSSVAPPPISEKRVPMVEATPHRLTREQADRCHTPAWSEPEIQTFVARVALFMRRAVSATDADDLAEALVLRDREGDDRRLCVECSHYRLGRCGNHEAAGLGSNAIGRALATLMQRCSGFKDDFEGGAR